MAPMGWADKAEESWAQDITALADSLASTSRLQAASFIIPDSWPTATKTLSKAGPGRALWTSHQKTLQNTCRRGTIETDHRLVCLLQPSIRQNFLIPDATVDTPADISPFIYHDLAPRMPCNTTSCTWRGLGRTMPTADSTSRNTHQPSTVFV